MKRQKNIFLMILLVFLLTNCQKDEKILVYPGTDADIVMFSNVKVIEDADFTSFVNQVDSATYTIQTDLALMEKYDLKAGDILVSSIGYGLLRMIDSTSIQQNIAHVYTSQATFEDAIDEGFLFYRETLTTQMIDSVEYFYEGIKIEPASVKDDENDDDIKFEFDVDLGYSVHLTGELTMNSDIIFELDISRLLRLRKVKYGFENNTESNIELSAGGGFSFNPSIKIFTIHFTPIVIPTVFPIIITPRLDVHVGMDGSAEASVVTTVGQTFNYEAGVMYERDDGWTTYSETTNEWYFNPPEVTLEASAAAYIRPELGLMLYGVIGAYMDSRVYSEISVTPLEIPWWKLYIGYRVGIGARARILSVDLFDVDYPELLANKWLIADSGEEDPPVTTSGFINGTVVDAVTSQYLANVTVKAWKDSSVAGSSQTDANGIYNLELPANDNYRVEFTRQGYIDTDYHNIAVNEDQTTYLEAVMQVDESYAGNGNIQGTITDAFDGQGVQGAEIKIREGMNNQEGNVITTVTSGSNGQYTISDIPGGNYTIEVNKTNYITAYASVVSIGGQTTSNQNVSITPIIDDEEIRIILDWGQFPFDLDSHLTGPIPGSQNRFHVYWVVMQFYFNNVLYAALDYDVIFSYGPETITIYQQTDGVYRYSVHDYTNRNSTTSAALSASNARVRVYFGSQLVNTFNVPGNTPGTLWTVFELEGQNITPINNMSFESNPSSVTKNNDADLIRNLPDKKHPVNK